VQLRKHLPNAKKSLPINVDGAIGAILADLGMNPAAFNGIFMIARTPGLIAHCHRRTNSREADAPYRSGQPRLRRATRQKS
jgi:citrate synthase